MGDEIVFNNNSSSHPLPPAWLQNATVPPPLSPASQPLFTDPTFDLVMGLWLPGLLCVLGTLGNGVSLYVLARYKGRNVTFYSLKMLAVSDLVLLLSAFVQQVVPMVCINWGLTEDILCSNVGYLRVYAWPVVCMAQMTSIWLVILISAERYQAIVQPLLSKSTHTITLVRKTVVSIITFSVLFNLPKFFEFQPQWVSSPTNSNVTIVQVGTTQLRENLVYRYLYNMALNGVLMYAMPIITLLYLNGNIIQILRNARRSLAMLSRKQQSEYKATTVPLCIVGVFVLCDTQAFVSFVLDAVYVDSYQPWVQYFTAISNLLVTFNSAVNFVIFYLFGSKFRRMLWHCFSCCKKGMIANNESVNSPIFRKRFTTIDRQDFRREYSKYEEINVETTV